MSNSTVHLLHVIVQKCALAEFLIGASMESADCFLFFGVFLCFATPSLAASIPCQPCNPQLSHSFSHSLIQSSSVNTNHWSQATVFPSIALDLLWILVYTPYLRYFTRYVLVGRPVHPTISSHAGGILSYRLDSRQVLHSVIRTHCELAYI